MLVGHQRVELTSAYARRRRRTAARYERESFTNARCNSNSYI